MDPLTREVLGAWEKVLRTSVSDPSTSFFSAGGDSILALELVSALAERGLRLTPKDIFQHPTAAAQVSLLASQAPAATAEEEPGESQSGAVALTPIQQWFFELDLEYPKGFVQACEVELARAPQPAHLQASLEALTATHPQLRAVFRTRRQGIQQMVLERGQAVPVLRVVDGTDEALPGLRQGAAAELDLGRRLQAAALLRRPDGSGHLVWVAHHLVVDTVSWRVLLQDLHRALTQCASGEPVHLQRRTSPYRAFADRLLSEADAEGSWAREAAHWAPLLEGKGALGQLAEPPASLRTADLVTATSSLARESTERLASLVARCNGPQLQDAALAAAFRALGGWAGRARFAVDFEHHGRRTWEELDLTRTVGWCTSLFPFLVEAPQQEPPREGLLRTYRALKLVPRDGAGFGLLRYLSREPLALESFAGYRDCQALVRFLGQAGHMELGEGLRLVTPEVVPVEPRNRAPHALVLSLSIVAGSLKASVAVARGFGPRSPEALAGQVTQELEALVQDLSEAEAVARAARLPPAWPPR